MAIITISRQFGSGGRTLGEKVAEKLGYEFLDDAIIQELSRRVVADKEAIADMKKNGSGLFSRLLSTMSGRSYMERLASDKSGAIEDAIYADALQDVINELAAHDNVVLLGRCSHFVLDGHPEAIHFLLVADKAQRVRFMQRHYNLSESQAYQEVLAGEKRRKQVYAKMGCTDSDDPYDYHMVLNMSRLSMEEALDQMVLLAERKQHEPIIPSPKRTWPE